uniref:Uncharacterized protein n=1 Tax=Ditylenchus dipsaci TaxID=166011 RepID=A0A915ETK7_9BILA
MVMSYYQAKDCKKEGTCQKHAPKTEENSKKVGSTQNAVKKLPAARKVAPVQNAVKKLQVAKKWVSTEKASCRSKKPVTDKLVAKRPVAEKPVAEKPQVRARRRNRKPNRLPSEAPKQTIRRLCNSRINMRFRRKQFSALVSLAGSTRLSSEVKGGSCSQGYYPEISCEKAKYCLIAKSEVAISASSGSSRNNQTEGDSTQLTRSTLC